MQTEKLKLLILVDGSSYLFRAYHALPPLTNSQGFPTGAVYGVINMLRKLINDYPSDYIAVIFDPKGKTTRHDWYPAYKAHRPTMPVELQGQIEPLHRIIEAMGLPLIIKEGIEADDVIGSIACQAKKMGFQVVISTGDKDMAQLVDESVTLINTMNNTLLDRVGVEKKFGVRPDQIIDYLALIGDPVDNIPGISKVGPKTAAKWLTSYGSIEGIIKNSDKISGKIGEALRAGIGQLALSQKLVTIDQHLPLDIVITDLCKREKNLALLRQFFERLEFKTWLKELNSVDDALNSSERIAPTKNYEIILSKEALEPWLERLRKAPLFAFDTETTGLNVLDAGLVGISFSVASNEAAYVPLAHDYLGAPSQLKLDFVLEQLMPIFNDSKKTIIGQNLKFDLQILSNYHVVLKNQLMDTMLESYVLNSTSGPHNMDSLAKRYLDCDTTSFVDIAGKGSKQLTFNQISLDQAGPYAAEDADITWQLHQVLSSKLASNTNTALRSVLYDIELPLISILARMESHGVLIDVDMLRAQSIELKKRMHVLEENIYQVVGKVFNISSPLQLQEILYNQLKLPILRKTPKGQPSTSEEVLQELSLDYPLPKLILDYRSLSKLKSTYTDRLPEQVDAKTGRVHCFYNQAVTATGRLSSTDPNLQNIPIRKKEGQLVRQAFIAPPHCQIVTADYSQIELRIMAHFSKDPGLLRAFAEGMDIHTATAAEVFAVPLDFVTPDQRRSAKAINFGLIYGMSAFGLAKQLGVSRQLAQEYIDRYFMRYPGVKAYMEKTREQAREQGYVETLRGRRLYLPDICSRHPKLRSAAERAAINAPMQGTAADIIKLAMINIDCWLQEDNWRSKVVPVMQVHDELVFEVATKDVTLAAQKIQHYMATAEQLDVPLLAVVGTGDNWQSAHP